MATSQQEASRTAGKACASCRLSHVSCDRTQPCWRCVRLGRADTCRPPPARKRGRPCKTPAAGGSAATLQEAVVSPRTLPKPHSAPAQARELPLPAAKRACTSGPRPPRSSSPPSHSCSSSLHSSPTSCDADSTTTTMTPIWTSSPAQLDVTEQVGHELSRPAAGAAMTLVVDRMREVLQENERLHATITDLRTRQELTENRLALLENAGSGVVIETATEVPRHRPIALEHNSEAGEFFVQYPTLLSSYDLASLIIINDQRKPWLLISLNEARTLAEVESPIVVYLSPAMRYLLGYDTHEGPPYNILGQLDTDTVALFVRLVMARPRTRVAQPISVASHFVTKHRRGFKCTTHAQMLYSEQGLAKWCVAQVQHIHGTSHGWASYIQPLRSAIFDPQFREHLLANVQHSLHFGHGAQQHPQPPTVAAPSSLPLRSQQGHQHEPQNQGLPHIGACDEHSPAPISSADHFYSDKLSLPVWDDPCTRQQQQQQMDGQHHQEESIGSEYCSVPSHYTVVRRSSATSLAERWLFL